MARKETKRTVTDEELGAAAEVLAYGWRKLARKAREETAEEHPPETTTAHKEAVASEDDPDDDNPGYYTIRTVLEKPLARCDLDVDFIDEYSGEIHYDREGFDRELAGRFRAFLVRLDDASDEGYPASWVLDAHSEGLYEFWDILFDPESEGFKEEIVERFEAYRGDLLVVDLIQILPAHRVKKVGLATMAKIIELWRGGCGLIACTPYPLQLNAEPMRLHRDDPPEREAFVSGMQMENFPADERTAFRQIRKHWSKLGLRRIGRSKVFAALGGREAPASEATPGLTMARTRWLERRSCTDPRGPLARPSRHSTRTNRVFIS